MIMTMSELANLYAHQIKMGELTKVWAVSYLRSRHRLDYITALEAMNEAIGDYHQYGLTYPDPYATL
jgi:hypothetical protein